MPTNTTDNNEVYRVECIVRFVYDLEAPSEEAAHEAAKQLAYEDLSRGGAEAAAYELEHQTTLVGADVGVPEYKADEDGNYEMLTD